MKKNICSFLFTTLILISIKIDAQSFSLQDITGYPFISEITATERGSKIALSINEKGERNLYAGEAPDFVLHKLTNYNTDEGIELTSVKLSPDGKWIIFVRGGDHGAFDKTIKRNPSSSIDAPKIQVFSLPFFGGKPILLGEGDYPVIDPQSKKVLFIKNGQVWSAMIDGSQKEEILFTAKGRNSDLQFSPDGSKLLFVSSRGDHSFIGCYSNDSLHIKWISPDFAIDQSPRWSPDGNKIVFIRMPASGGIIDSMTVRKRRDWSIWTTDINLVNPAKIWEAPKTLSGSVPASEGRFNLHWAANDRIIFLSYQDGWPHLYSLSAAGGKAELLTPGKFNVEQIILSPDKKWLAFTTNTGKDKDDFDRRHIARVLIDEPKMEILTPGNGIESTPVFTDNGTSLVFLSATARRPTLPAIMSFAPGKFKLLGEDLIQPNFPVSALVMPKSVQFKASDGQTVYGQLFMPASIKAKNPAILFVHGGPQRQMLLGWHYMDYYANTYAVNQYLVSKGFIVLSVNYRLGIGYGFDFQTPEHAGRNGASEYKDIKAAGLWLASQPGVDAKKIGIYGGSYGGFLTAMALARDSKIFSAGVDISGMHNFMLDFRDFKNEIPPDFELAKKLAWESSPAAYLKTWTSPVLILSGDDDGNVPVDQSIDMIRRFQEKKFPFESIIFPDETHHWMKYSNMLRLDSAIAEFLERKLK